MPDTEADNSMLNDDQRRRAEALQLARNVLASKPFLFTGSNVPEVRSVGDLTYLAEWILGGMEEEEEGPSPENLPTAAELLDGSGETIAEWRSGTVPDSDEDAANAEHEAARSDVDDGV